MAKKTPFKVAWRPDIEKYVVSANLEGFPMVIVAMTPRAYGRFWRYITPRFLLGRRRVNMRPDQLSVLKQFLASKERPEHAEMVDQ